MSWPTPLWSLGAVGMYVNDIDPQQEAVIGELHVIDALNSTKHHSGSTGLKLTVSAVLVCTNGTSGIGSELATLLGYLDSATSRTLTSDQGSMGDFKVKSIRTKRKQALGYAYPIWELSIDLWEA